MLGKSSDHAVCCFHQSMRDHSPLLWCGLLPRPPPDDASNLAGQNGREFPPLALFEHGVQLLRLARVWDTQRSAEGLGFQRGGFGVGFVLLLHLPRTLQSRGYQFTRDDIATYCGDACDNIVQLPSIGQWRWQCE